jgi:hypothetical protein
MLTSARDTADTPDDIECIFYIDEDDTPSMLAADDLGASYVSGPRIVLSKMWNACLDQAIGPIYMHGGDDIIFRSNSWDTKVREAFEAIPDRIALVYGDDLLQGQGMATHGFYHQRWIDVLGRLCPPYFVSDYNDFWNHQIAAAVGRLVFLSDVITEHMHYAAGKSECDATYQERLTRHHAENVDALYQSLEAERQQDIGKLMAAIRG